MYLSWTEAKAKFKSPSRVVPWFLWRSRETKAQKCRNVTQQLKDAKATIARQDAEIQRQRDEIVPWKSKGDALKSRTNSRPGWNTAWRRIRRSRGTNSVVA